MDGWTIANILQAGLLVIATLGLIPLLFTMLIRIGRTMTAIEQNSERLARHSRDLKELGDDVKALVRVAAAVETLSTRIENINGAVQTVASRLDAHVNGGPHKSGRKG